MATTAQGIIEAAYVTSTANDAGRLATDAELLGQLNRDYQARYALWTNAAAEGAISAQTLTFSGLPAAVTLPTDVIDIVRLEVDDEPVNLIPVTEKTRLWHLPPAVYRRGLQLVSRGMTGDPQSGDGITLFLNDAPMALSSLSSVVDERFPVRFHNLLVYKLALYLDAKDEGRSAEQHAKLQRMYDELNAIFLAEAPVSNSAKDRSTNPKSAD